MISHVLSGLAAATALAVPALLFSPRAAFAQETGTAAAAASHSGIVVQGTGEVKVTPDIAQVMLGVITQDKDATRAGQANAAKTDAVIKAIRAAGIPEKDVQTSGYSLNPVYQGGLGGSGGGNQNQPPALYEARNSVTVTVRNISDTGKVIDAAIKAGANLAGGISFSLNDEAAGKARDEALRRAVTDAKRKAVVIAKAASTGAIDLAAIIENGVAFPRPYTDFSAMAARGMPAPAVTPVTPGEQSVTATVTIRYTINNFLQPNY
jgi:uncharacterized protein YggE